MKDEHQLNYRQQLTSDLFEQFVRGESVSVVSVPGNGKTHWVNHILRPPVQDFMLQDVCGSSLSHKTILVARLNANGLSARSATLPDAWPGFDLILRRLIWAVNESDLTNKEEALRQLQRSLQKIGNRENHGPERAVGIVEHALWWLVNMLPPITRRVVLLFEEPERWIDQMPDEFFLNLSYWRDSLYYELMYIVVGRQSVERLIASRNKTAALDSFVKVFRSTQVMGLFVRPDFEALLADLLWRVHGPDWVFPENAKEMLFWITGGHGGLVRSCLDHLDLIGTVPHPEKVAQRLLKADKVHKECARLFTGLASEEQAVLKAVSENAAWVSQARGEARDISYQLSQKGLLDLANEREVTVLPLLLGQFIREEITA